MTRLPPSVLPLPVPLAMPPPPGALLCETVLLFTVSVPAWLRIPPPPPPPVGVNGTVFPLTSLSLTVMTPTGPLPMVPVAIPPPPPPDEFPRTITRFNVTAPSLLKRPPPGPCTRPPLIVIRFSVSAPPAAPRTSMIRKVLLLPAIVDFSPFTVIGATMTGRPLPPSVGLFATVSEYVQPDARLIVPPPAALAAVTAATSPAPPAEQGTVADAAPALPAAPTRSEIAAQPTIEAAATRARPDSLQSPWPLPSLATRPTIESGSEGTRTPTRTCNQTRVTHRARFATPE